MTVSTPERLWFPRGPKLESAWKIRLVRESPREEWIVYVNTRSGAILNKWDKVAPSWLHDKCDLTKKPDQTQYSPLSK